MKSGHLITLFKNIFFVLAVIITFFTTANAFTSSSTTAHGSELKNLSKEIKAAKRLAKDGKIEEARKKLSDVLEAANASSNKKVQQRIPRKVEQTLKKIEGMEKRQVKELARENKRKARKAKKEGCENARPKGNRNPYSDEWRKKGKDKWIEELDANLNSLGLTINDCSELKMRREGVVGAIASSKIYKQRGRCIAARGHDKGLNQYALGKLDEGIKAVGLSTNECPKVWELRDKMVAYIKQKEQEKKERERLAAIESKKRREAENAVRGARVATHYKSGLFKKFTSEDLKEEEEARRSSMKKKGLNYEEWVAVNKSFESNHAKKLKLLKSWEMIYMNYMTIKLCAKNQGSFDLIQNISEIKGKMKVIGMMLPLQIDPDVLWSRVEGGVFALISRVDGLLSDIDFRAKMGANCKQQQTLLRMNYNRMTRALTIKKRKSSKRDF